MTTVIPLEKAKQTLDTLITHLPLGETITLVDAGGAPMALVVSLKEPPKPKRMGSEEWMAAWQLFVAEVDEAWQGEESMVNTLLEMRR